MADIITSVSISGTIQGVSRELSNNLITTLTDDSEIMQTLIIPTSEINILTVGNSLAGGG